MSLKGKVVLVTGGSAGIGAATAIKFAKEEASIAIVGRNEDRLKKVAKSCEEFGIDVLIIKADISKDDEANKIVEKTVKKFGKLDILINNAAILKKSGILDKNFLEVYDEIVATNMRAVVRLTYFAVPYIIKTKGNIVNISSIAALCTKTTHYIAYKSSKASLNHFTRNIALELSEYGVRINSVSPGPVETNIFEGMPDAEIAQLKDFTAFKRFSDPEEIADLIIYLASDKAKSITGADYVIDNGVMLK